MKRIYKLGEYEIRFLSDNINERVRYKERYKEDINDAIRDCFDALAEIKTQLKFTNQKIETYKAKSKDYYDKAVILIERAREGQIAEQEADRLAEHALRKHNESRDFVQSLESDLAEFTKLKEKIELKIRELDLHTTGYYINDEILELTDQLNDALSDINYRLDMVNSGKNSLYLSRIKDKIEKDLLLSQIEDDYYGDYSYIDYQIDKALEQSKKYPSDALLSLKKKIAGPDKTQEEKSSPVNMQQNKKSDKTEIDDKK